MKSFIVCVLFLISYCTQLKGMSDELCRQAWFVYPWEKIEQEYEKNQVIPDISIHDIPECKNNVPDWVTDAWVNQLVACSKESIKIKDISLVQESEGIESIISAQGLDDSFKQAFNAYLRAHTDANQLEPVDIFLACFVSEDDVKFFTCIFSPTSQRHQIKLKPSPVSLLRNRPLITSQGSNNLCGGILFVSLAYGLLLAIAYLGEGPSA